MAQEQQQHQPHGAEHHAGSGDSMQNLVMRLLLAASQTPEPVASELKDIAMSLSCATMAAAEDSAPVGVKDGPSSTRHSAVPSRGVLTDGTRAPPHSRDGSRGDMDTSTALVLRSKALLASLRDAATPPCSQQYGAVPQSKPCTLPSSSGPQPSLQLDVGGQRGFPTAGAKRSCPFDDSNVTEPKRQQMGFPAGPPGRRPVCRECFSAGLAESCDHTARCGNCKTRGNVNCVYVACAQGMGCTAPQCYFMHPDQWNKNDRPVWQLKTAHLPGAPGAPVPGPRPLPPAPKPRRKNEGSYGRRPWTAPRQMPWHSGATGGTFTAHPPFQPAIAGPMSPLAPQNAFASLKNGAVAPMSLPVVSTPFTFPKIEPNVGNAASGRAASAAPAAPESEFPRGLLKYETDE